MVWIPAILSLLILMIASIATVSASPQLPCEFYGAVSISGSPAPVGTEITAYVNGVKQGSITVKEPGRYGGTGTFDERLIVLSGENDFTGGAPMITFKIGDKVADQTATYTPGTSTEMAMTSGGTPVVVPVPVATSSPVVPMQVQSAATPIATVVPPVPVVPVATSAPVALLQVSASSPVVPVVTASPVTQGSPSLMSVASVANGTQTVTSQPTLNQTNTGAVQTPVPVVQVPVIPVVTASPVIIAVTSSPNQTPVVTPVQTRAVNQTNQTNVSAPAPSPNVTSAVAFPSGQTITK